MTDLTKFHARLFVGIVPTATMVLASFVTVTRYLEPSIPSGSGPLTSVCRRDRISVVFVEGVVCATRCVFAWMQGSQGILPACTKALGSMSHPCNSPCDCIDCNDRNPLWPRRRCHNSAVSIAAEYLAVASSSTYCSSMYSESTRFADRTMCVPFQAYAALPNMPVNSMLSVQAAKLRSDWQQGPVHVTRWLARVWCH